MKFNKDYMPSLAGSLLVAHPAMIDPNFCQSIILVCSHSPENGSLGIIINRPLHKTLQEIDSKFALTPLANIPVYLGGPAAHNAALLVAWEWLDQNNVFKLHFGISEEQVAQLLQEKSKSAIEVRAFLGHCKWVAGQLENELYAHTFFLSSVKNLIGESDDAKIWQAILTKVKPELLFLVDPEDPSLN